MKTGSAAYFCNESCEYYPCHRIGEAATFNCLFCYCPLYALGDGCGGSFCYTDKGIKDCGNCLIPHKEGGYEHIMERLGDVMKLAEQRR